MDEQILWKTFLEGNRSSFEAIFNRCYKALYQYGYKITQEQELVDDCIQDLFFELWAGRERLGEVDSVKGYLFRALRYKLFRATKKDARFSHLDGDHSGHWEGSHESQLIMEEQNDAIQKRLSHYLEQLSPRQREAISLRFHNQMGYEEISDVMSISYPAAVNLIYKSLKYLRENMISLPGLLLAFAWLQLLR